MTLIYLCIFEFKSVICVYEHDMQKLTAYIGVSVSVYTAFVLSYVSECVCVYGIDWLDYCGCHSQLICIIISW